MDIIRTLGRLALVLALALVASSASAQVCIEIVDPLGLEPTFEFEVTASSNDSLALVGFQRLAVGINEQPVYGSAIVRSADDLVKVAWSKQGSFLFESFRCDIALSSSSGPGTRTSLDETGATLVDITCDVVSC